MWFFCCIVYCCCSFASTADSITFIVAPTDTISIYIEFPINLLALACIVPFPTDTVAPSVSKPFYMLVNWSCSNLHPPGIPTSISPFLPSIAPII